MALGNASDVVVGLGNDGDDVSFLGAVYRGLVVGVRWLLGKGNEPKQDSAIEILRQRYARGEINKEEFEVKKKDLGG
jgi:putative membrane protein